MADSPRSAITKSDYPFHLEGFTVKERKESTLDHRVLYILQPETEMDRECPACEGKLHVLKKSTLKVRDLEEYGKEVGLLIEDKSYRCQNCGKVCKASYPALTNQLTTRLFDSIVRDSYREGTFTDVAKRYHISVSKVQNAFEQRGAELLRDYQLVMPKVLGIDEVHLNNAYYGVFVKVDKKSGCILELSEARTKAAVKDVLRKFEHPENLKYVTMDMWKAYRDAVLDVFPNVPVIIDRFHVIKELIRCLDKIRSETCKRIKETKNRTSLKRNRYLLLADHENLTPRDVVRLNELLDSYPQFRMPYDLKESFRSIYDLAKTKAEAIEMFEDWCSECQKSGIDAYDSFIKMVCKWQPEIFAYFDFSGPDRTNAQTESFNRTIRDVARNGRGYSFHNLRLKMLFGTKTPSSTRFDFDSFFIDDTN